MSIIRKLTPHFSLSEFKCPLAGDPPLEYIPTLIKLCEQLEVIRAELNSPIRVISGYRSKAYNFQIKGAPNSQHLEATAADIKVHNYESADVHRVIQSLIAEGKILNGGLGLYPTFVHYDIRSRPARWKGGGL